MGGITVSEKAISLPFQFDSYGKISTSSTLSNIWSDRVLSVMGTLKGERVMEPDFGTYLATFVHGNSSGVETSIETEVEQAFIKFLPLLNLVSTEVVSNEFTGSLDIVITYELPNEEEQTTVVALAAISRKQPIYQENL
jgi:phage baseplate assembly protein W